MDNIGRPEPPKAPAADQIHLQVLFPGRQPIPATAETSERVTDLVARVMQQHAISAPPNNRREITWEAHGHGAPRRTAVDEGRTLGDLGVRNGDKLAITWAAVNG